MWSAVDHQDNQPLLTHGVDFRSSDRDGDGSISLSELWLASERLPHLHRFEVVEKVFHLVDVKKTGVLDVTEYLDAIFNLEEGDWSGS